jgi:hypothetical protein
MALNEDPIPFSQNGKLWDTRRVTAPDSIAQSENIVVPKRTTDLAIGPFSPFSRDAELVAYVLSTR